MLTSALFTSGRITSRMCNERAASLVEYALRVGLIAVVCIVVMSTLGKQASSRFASVTQSL